MRRPVRHSPILLALTVILFAGAAPSSVQAKRYLLKRDAVTGKVTLIDPDEGILQKLTKPVLRPVRYTARTAKRLIFGKPKPKSALPGFSREPMTQKEFQTPPGGITTVASDTGKSAASAAFRVANTVGAGGVVRTSTGVLKSVTRKVVGGSGPKKAAPVANASSIYQTATSNEASSLAPQN